jgi:phage shock protein PspC (stress-responsive transcriptional regulator)
MAIKKASKAIAGAVAGVAVAWVGHFTGVTIPAETVEWASAALATGIAGLLGYAIVWISPPNEPS